MPRFKPFHLQLSATAHAPAGDAADPAHAALTVQRRQLAAGDDQVTVDRDNLRINNVSIMSIGPAAGHGFEIDATTLDTLVNAFNQPEGNIVTRFTHPETDWTGGKDGLEYQVGRPENLRVVGDAVRGDIQLGQYAQQHAPGRNADYILAIAEEDPRAIGISVVAYFDFEHRRDPASGEVTAILARVTHLQAVDFVGRPATNRQGLLSTPPAQPPASTQEPTMKRAITYLRKLGSQIALNATRAQVDAAIAALSDANQQGIARCLLLDDGSIEGGDPRVNYFLTAKDIDPDTFEALAADPAPTNPTPAPAPANTPAGPTVPAPANLSQADVERLADQRVQSILTARDEHATAVRALATTHGLDQAWVDTNIAHGNTHTANQNALAALAERNQPIAGLATRATGGEDGRVQLAQAIHDAFLIRLGTPIVEIPGDSPTGRFDRPIRPLRAADGSGYQLRAANERAHSLEALTCVEMCRLYLRTLGVDDLGLDQRQAVQACFDRDQLAALGVGSVALSHSTSDFPAIFANVLNKVLLPAYEEEESTWESWATEREVPNFKEARIINAGNIQVPPRVLEGAEYTFGTIGEKYETLQAFKYGILFAWTWEMMVDDDLGAFDRAIGFAQSAKALENDLVYGKVTANPTMNEDNTALFHADHNNLNEGADGDNAPTIQVFNAMLIAMALQKAVADADNGNPGRAMNLRMNTILCPFSLGATIRQLVASVVKPGGTNNEPNFDFVRNLRVVEESRLDADSTTAYYSIAAKRRALPAMLVAKLRGYKSPTIERLNTGSSVDGITMKLRHVSGAGVGDWRPWQKNTGA